jgi:predicted esterase
MLPRAAFFATAAFLTACSNHAIERPTSAAPPSASWEIEAAPPPPPTPPVHRTQIAVPENNPLELYPPRTPSARAPLIVALHGKDMDPIDLCELWKEEGRAQGWLACPAGNAPGGASFDWGGPTADRIDALDAQLASIDGVYGSLIDHERGDILVGFSRGAFLARDLVYARPGRFRGLILLGAAATLDADRLRAAGIRRVVLAAGDRDDARRTMLGAADRLAARGLPARFMGLGDIPHALPPDLARVMKQALAWVREDG